jgi:hypothetical protein
MGRGEAFFYKHIGLTESLFAKMLRSYRCTSLKREALYLILKLRHDNN